MTATNATATLTIQWTPPNATPNSGQASYALTCSCNAQNVGILDVSPGVTPPVFNSIPFGSITSLKMLILKNLQSTDIGVRLNGGSTIVAHGAAATVFSFSTPTATITGLSGMTSAYVGGTLTITGAATGGNNGTFTIVSVLTSGSVTVTNASANASDANNGSLGWVAIATTDNFRVPANGEFAYLAAAAPLLEPITSVTIVSIANPLTVESVCYFTYGD